MNPYYENENHNLNSDNSQNQNPNNGQNNYERMDPTPSSMSVASLAMGILSIVTVCCPALSIILGALGIIFSLLSRKRREKLNGNAQIGLIISILGLILGFFVTIGSIIYVVKELNSDQMPQYLEQYKELLGDDYQDFYDKFYDLDNSL